MFFEKNWPEAHSIFIITIHLEQPLKGSATYDHTKTRLVWYQVLQKLRLEPEVSAATVG